MSGKKSVLIITDGAEKVSEMAKGIAGALAGNKVLVREASAFAGTDLLPVQILLLGCEKPSPPSFQYLDEMLQHINLAGRKCGVFSPLSKKGVQYLTRIVRDSEITLNPEMLVSENTADISKWTAGIVSG